MIHRQRVVVDTNVLVSGVLSEESSPGRAIRLAEDRAHLLASIETRDEFSSVLLRRKFDRYAELAIRHALIERYKRIVEMIAIPSPIRACHDPKTINFSLLPFSERRTF